MQQPQALTIAKELADLLQERQTSETMTEFRQAQIRREFLNNIPKLEQLAPKDALSLYIYWYALEGDLDSCKQCFRQKAENYGLVADDWQKLGYALGLLGCDSEAAEAYQKVVQLDPADLPAHRDWLVRLMMIGACAEAVQATEALMKKGVETPPYKLSELNQYTQFLDEQGINQQEVEQMFRISEAVVQSHNTYLTGVRVNLLEDEEGESLSLQFSIRGDTETAVSMNLALAHQMVKQKVPDHVEEAILINYS